MTTAAVETSKLPPGPSAPAIVQLGEWVARPFAFMEECARRYGDTFTVRIAGFGTLVYCAAPDDIRAVFAAPPERLHAGEANWILGPVVGPQSVLLLDGGAHLRQRRLLSRMAGGGDNRPPPASPSSPFQGERMHAYAAAMRDATLRSLAEWPVDRPFALHPFMRAITLDVILRTVFGVEAGADAKAPLARAIERVLDVAGSRLALLIPATIGLLGRRALLAAGRFLTREMDAAIQAEIDERRAAGAPERNDIFSLLLRARDEDGSPMTDAEVRDELVTLLVAGHETTATALAWTFDLLLRDAGARARAQAEVAADPGFTHLEFLDAAIKESLRLRPIIPIVVREVKERGFRLGSYEVPVEHRVAPCIYLAQRRAATWGEDADRFRPERFLGARPDPATWLPFGGGTRRCIGQWFALFEMRVVIATVLASARIEAAPGPASVPGRRGITIAPADGARVVLGR